MTLLTFFMPTYFNYHFYTDVSSDPFKTSAPKNHLPSILIHNFYLYFSGPVFRAIWHPDLFTWSDYYFAVS